MRETDLLNVQDIINILPILFLTINHALISVFKASRRRGGVGREGKYIEKEGLWDGVRGRAF